MARYEKKTFTNQEVKLDGNDFIGCHFDQCRIIFGGAQPCSLNGPSFLNCRFAFEGPAVLTIQFLEVLYANGAKDLIEQTFANIRNGATPSS